MKRIFLMSLLVVALLSIFAITAFAEDIIASKIESEEYGTVIQLSADPGLDNAGKYVSTLKKISDAGTDTEALCILTDGAETPSYYVFPSSYIVDEREDGVFDLIATPLATAMAEFNTANGTSYFANYAIDGSGGGKRLNSLVRFTFPSSVLSASAGVCCIRSYPSLAEIIINHSINFSAAEKMFYSNKKLASVIGFEKVDGTKLSKTMFASCSALRYIKLPTNIVSVPGSFFQGAVGVNVVNMDELTQLTTIEAWAFDGTQSLVITLPDSVTTLKTSSFESAFKQGGSITINPTSQLTTIGYKAFSGSVKLDSIYIPSTVTYIDEHAFNGSGVITLENFENCQITTLKKSTFEAASRLTSIKLPETVTTIENAFLGNQSLKTVYIPTSVTSVADTFVRSTWVEAPTNITFLYIGKDTSIFEGCAVIAGATVINASDYVETNTYTGMNLVVGYSRCLAYNNGVHSETVADYIFTTYLEAIKIVDTCTLCGMVEENGKIDPLFTCLGYSSPSYGNGGIVLGFTVNKDSVAEYAAATGKTFKYGVFAVSKNNLGNNDIFGEDGIAADGVINADLSNREYSVFQIKITGFTNDDKKNAKLALGAFVCATDGASKEYSYMQVGTPDEGEKYSFVSYNDIVG